MIIQVKISKSKNASYYNCSIGDTVNVELEQYVAGVVASEIGNAPVEACKAQAVAARTTACLYVQKNKAISDSGSTAQAFNASRLTGYNNAHLAAKETAGQILYYGKDICSPCPFSASNGGRTTSSKERWGGERAWLISQEDPWDFAETHGKKTGHGVGMSQVGAKHAADLGYDYKQILSFYYPGTHIGFIKGDDDMAAYKNVKASYLIDKFKMMKENNWKYVADAAEYGKVDCSGAFTYWYKQAGSYMYHGSNTMYRKYSTEKGKIGEIKLVPGMAVYRWKKAVSGEMPSAYVNDGLGNFKHVGMYIGNGKCIEAKGKQYGVVESDISTWDYASKLKYTIYDVEEGQEDEHIVYGTVRTENGKLNLRNKPDKSGAIITRVPSGTKLQVLDKCQGWYKVKHEGRTLYADADFVMLGDIPNQKYTITVTVDEAIRDTVLDAIKKAGGSPVYKAVS